MGPTKAAVKDSGIYDAKTRKLIKDGLTTHEAIHDYAAHHYLVLPVVNKTCQPWLLDGQPIFCLRGTRYENRPRRGAALSALSGLWRYGHPG